MRIVGGKYKSRVLADFEKIGVRPTSDMVRESVFNILSFRIPGASFLDLFSGTGAMGIEALSRGASKVIFNDSSRESIKLIKKNLEKLKVTDPYEVLCLDAITLLKRGQAEYDIIYIDPPYACDFLPEVLSAVENCLSADGIAIVENDKPLDIAVKGLTAFDKRKYGRAHLTFYRREERQ